MGAKPKVLCVDDQAQNLRIRMMLLEQFGCDAVAAYDHQSALRILDDTKIDLVILDYHLGGESTGEDVARDLRHLRPNLPLIMLTGDWNLPNHARHCVDAVLIKGTDSAGELLNTIRRLLPDAVFEPRRLSEIFRREAS